MWTGGEGLLGRVVGQGHTAPKRCAKPDLGSFASQSYPYCFLLSGAFFMTLQVKAVWLLPSVCLNVAVLESFIVKAVYRLGERRPRDGSYLPGTLK